MSYRKKKLILIQSLLFLIAIIYFIYFTIKMNDVT